MTSDTGKCFENCGLDCNPSDNHVLSYIESDLEEAKEMAKRMHPPTSTNWGVVMRDALYRYMVGPEWLMYEFPDHGIFFLRPETDFEERSGLATYRIFQVPLLHGSGFDHAFIVLDKLKAGTDMRKEIIRKDVLYRTRGVTKPLHVVRPSVDVFNEESSWVYWSDAPQDFNQGLITI